MSGESGTDGDNVATDLVARLTVLIGDAASIDKTEHGYSVKPMNTNALSLSIRADQWLLIQSGHLGGQWQLDFDSEKDMQLARDIVCAVVAGRVTERFGRRRSVITITREDGSTQSETGFDGLLALIPQPGWTKTGRLVEYEAYS